MGWFYLSWIIVSAVYVSCQELNTSLPEGNDACTRNEVNFTCTISGSPNLTVLILSWSSVEYIGRGDTLQFTSDTMSGTNIVSVINENVTAILTNNTMMDGVPVLVSELRIVNANQNSMIICDSITNEGSASTNFIVPVFPNSPQNVAARQVSQDCSLLLTWNHPANTDRSGLTYKIYIPSRNIVIADVSNTNHEFNVINCRDDDVRVLVAAVNRFGCEGPNSSQIQPILLEIPTVPPEAQLDRGAIAGIVVTVMVVVGGVVLLVVSLMVAAVKVYKEQKRQKEQIIAEQKREKEQIIAEQEQEKEQIIAEQEREKEQLWIESHCVKVLDGLKWGVHPSELVQESMLRTFRKISATNIQRGLISFIGTKLTSATGILFVLRRLKKMNLPVMSTFDTELESAGSSVTMDRLIKEANKGQRGELTEELKPLLTELTRNLHKANPERVKELLLNLFKELRNAKEERDELQDIIDKVEEIKMKAGISSRLKDRLGKAIKLLKDENSVEWMDIIQPSKPSSQKIPDPEPLIKFQDDDVEHTQAPVTAYGKTQVEHTQAPVTAYSHAGEIQLQHTQAPVTAYSHAGEIQLQSLHETTTI